MAAFHRRGSLAYTPGVNDVASFTFFPDTTPFNLTEDRNFNTTGLKADYTYRLSEHLQFKTGGLASFTRGHEDFTARDQSGAPGPASNSDLKGNDEWIYAQTVIAPSEQWELRTGVRYDNHEAPFAGSQHQVSPRVKLSFFPDAQTTIWAYYGRLFVPTNVEDLRAITSVAQGGVVATPTLPERDHFFEVGVVHRFPGRSSSPGSPPTTSKARPGIDDNTVPGSHDHHLGEHRPGADQRRGDGSRGAADRPTVGLSELRAQPCLRDRPHHRRILPGRQPAAATSISTTISGSPPSPR